MPSFLELKAASKEVIDTMKRSDIGTNKNIVERFGYICEKIFRDRGWFDDELNETSNLNRLNFGFSFDTILWKNSIFIVTIMDYYAVFDTFGFAAYQTDNKFFGCLYETDRPDASIAKLEGQPVNDILSNLGSPLR